MKLRRPISPAAAVPSTLRSTLFATLSATLLAVLPLAPACAAEPGPVVTVGDTTYIGDFRFTPPSGLAVGQGRVEWRNGDWYEGGLSEGLRTGKGVFVSRASGFRYEGDWIENRQNGNGKTRFDDGDVYEGEMKDGLYHGQGSYLSKNGTRYDGQWKDGLKDGQGKLTFPDGDNWEGRFSNDQRTQEGQMNFVARLLAEAPADDALDDTDEIARFADPSKSPAGSAP